jgi:hypothetical protein
MTAFLFIAVEIGLCGYLIPATENDISPDALVGSKLSNCCQALVLLVGGKKANNDLIEPNLVLNTYSKLPDDPTEITCPEVAYFHLTYLPKFLCHNRHHIR